MDMERLERLGRETWRRRGHGKAWAVFAALAAAAFVALAIWLGGEI